MEDLLGWWSVFRWGKFANLIWQAIPLAVLWSLWKLRNEVVFQSKQAHLEEVCDLIKFRIAIWVKTHSSVGFYSMQEIVNNVQQFRGHS